MPGRDDYYGVSLPSIQDVNSFIGAHQPEMPPLDNASYSSSIASSPLPDNVNFEHHGPRSFLAICSEKALNWLRAHVPPTEEENTVETLRRLAFDITRRLKLARILNPVRTPEPEAQTAWEYSQGKLPFLPSVINAEGTNLCRRVLQQQGRNNVW